MPTEKKWIPKVIASGYLTIFNNLPCYNLDNGQRVFRFTDMTLALTGKSHGKFGNYIATENIRPYVPMRLQPTPDRARTPQGVTQADFNGQIIPTYDATDFIDVCLAFTQADDKNEKLSIVQQEIVERARKFIIASAKTGITGLIDEATGYQYLRPSNELELKMAFFLVDEYRAWEKTFPDQFWKELGRLTNWTDLKKRPKYWGKLVNEFIYEALDQDIAKYLQTHKPPKYTGQRYHQWLNEDRGVKALTEHIWTVIGLAKTCSDIDNLRYEIGMHFSRNLFQPMIFSRKELSGPSLIQAEKNQLQPKDKKLQKWLKEGGREGSKQDFKKLLKKTVQPSET